MLYIVNIKAGYCLVGFFLCCMLLPIIELNAQYTVSGEVLDVNNSYRDVVVSLSSKSSKERINLSRRGQFITSLKWGEKYAFSFKKEGYVTKVIEFSTVLPDNKDNSTIAPYDLPVRLFKIFEGVDTVFFKNPIAKIRYDATIGDFSADRDYALKVKYKIEQMRKRGKDKPPNKRVLVKPSAPKKEQQSKAQAKKSSSKRTIVGNIDRTENNELLISFEEIKGVPPLKQNYPEGEISESFELPGRMTHRTIFTFEGQRRVFLFVKHQWGGKFYFIEQAGLGYRCISCEVYNMCLQKYRTIIKKK